MQNHISILDIVEPNVEKTIFIQPVYNSTKQNVTNKKEAHNETERIGDDIITREYVINTQTTTTVIHIFNSTNVHDGIPRKLNDSYILQNDDIYVTLEVDKYDEMEITVNISKGPGQKV